MNRLTTQTSHVPNIVLLKLTVNSRIRDILCVTSTTISAANTFSFLVPAASNKEDDEDDELFEDANGAANEPEGFAAEPPPGPFSENENGSVKRKSVSGGGKITMFRDVIHALPSMSRKAAVPLP